MSPIVGGDPGGGIGIDADQPVAGSPSGLWFWITPTREKLFHAEKRSSGMRSPLAQWTSNQWVLPLTTSRSHHQQRDQNGHDAQAVLPGLVVPERGGDRVDGGGGDHGAGSAGHVQKQNQQETADGRARQIEEIGAMDALDGFGDRDRDDGPGQEERHRGREVDCRPASRRRCFRGKG